MQQLGSSRWRGGLSTAKQDADLRSQISIFPVLHHQ